MSFQICIKTDKPLQQLATEIRDLLSLPRFTQNSPSSEPYIQFEMFGVLVLLHPLEEEERDLEVFNYPYAFNLQMSFSEHKMDTDTLEYHLQPYYAQLLTFHLGIETACLEKQKIGQHWQVRYNYYCRNPHWKEAVLYGEEGWEPAVITPPPSPWRRVYPRF